MEIKIIQYSKDYLDILYLAGRNCYGMEEIKENITQELKENFIKKLIQNYHESVLEHCFISIYIKDCSRSFMAQITRHRLCSFSIKSQHFTKHNNFKYKMLETNIFAERYINLMDDINKFYNDAIIEGMPIHIAREVLSNSCLTNIFMTANIREWRHIINMRITKNNTNEIRFFADTILFMFSEIMPILFNDLEIKHDKL